MASPFWLSSASWLVVLVLELLDAHLEAPRRHREFRAQQILVGLDLRHRLRDGVFQPPNGQPHRAAVDERDDGHPNEGCKQKPDPEIHDRFDHLSGTPNSIGSWLHRE